MHVSSGFEDDDEDGFWVFGDPPLFGFDEDETPGLGFDEEDEP